MLSTHRLHLLVELSHRGTVTEVARALSYSPSTISQQLHQLELEVGSALIERVGRRVALTPAGEVLVRHAQLILVQLDRAESELAAARDAPTGIVRMASFQTAAKALVPDLLDELSILHPDLAIRLSEIQPDTGASTLLARDYDLVLGESYPGLAVTTVAGIEQRLLFSDPLQLYAPTLGPNLRLENLAEIPWVLEPQGKPARDWADSICRHAGFEPLVHFESTDLSIHARLAETGHAAALIPGLVWAARIPAGPRFALPGDPARDVFTAVREGTEKRPALVALRHGLALVAERLIAEATLATIAAAPQKDPV